ncbi:sensor histidine kinase [Amycolatopsis sp.]|uniref:sensor histidine kinase n=1 Tax=Amycolatopsis sp. TaxID=37632 RepID=UPI002BE7FAFC|nr:histidine kinase [Amycolatopsis sp.]HVV08907.1 histidine kinase [Amycolatopsis sp.]
MFGGESRARGLWRAHPFVADASLAVLLFGATCVLGVVYHLAGARPFDAPAFVLTGLISLPLAFRRTVPFLMLALSSLAYCGYLFLGHAPDLAFWCPAPALYTVAALRSLPVTLTGAVLCAAVLFQSGMVSPEGTLGIALAQAVVIPVVVLILGRVAWRLDERNRQLAETTEELRREQQLSAERAVTEERLHIARELHDVVAHHLSVISMQAGLAGFVFDSDRATARTAVATIGHQQGNTGGAPAAAEPVARQRLRHRRRTAARARARRAGAAGQTRPLDGRGRDDEGLR